MEYSIERINEIVSGGFVGEAVAVAEFAQNLQFENLIREMETNIGDAEEFCILLLITGPSASGKTTFSNKLADYFEKNGAITHLVSLDNYYYDVETIQRIQLEKGFVPDEGRDFDYESIDAFNIPKFRRHMRDFINGKEVKIPNFDFTLKKPHGVSEVIKRTGKDFIIIEGIQAMNREMTESLKFDRVFRLYISPFDTYSYGGKTVFTPKEIRFMKRCVRDFYTRDAGIMRTAEMWPNVRAGEERDIKIHKKDAIFLYNSSVFYELPYLAAAVLKMTSKLTEREMEDLSNILDVEKLKLVSPIERLELPESAIFNEFNFSVKD